MAAPRNSKDAPAVGTAAPKIVGEIILVDPGQIDSDLPGRIGLYFPAKVEGLAARIDVDGQLEPILIAKGKPRSKLPWRLIAGRHRQGACALLGRFVEARVVTGTEAELMRMQADENLSPRTMTVLERSMFVAAVADAAQRRLAETHGAMSQQALAGKARAARSNMDRADIEPARAIDIIAAADADAIEAMDNLSTAYGWKAEVAEACGLGEKDVQRALRIHRCIAEPHRALLDGIKDHPIADNQTALLALAGKPEVTRAAALAWFAEHPEATTLDQALVALGVQGSRGDRPADRAEGQTQFLDRATSNIDRLSPATWISWAPVLAEKIKPSALIAVRDAINARIAEMGGNDA